MDLKLSEAEIVCLRKLEERVRQMFEFTGWEDDVDDDARVSVLRVQDALDNLDAFKRVESLVRSADSANGNKL
jgi:hypothetical protein